MEICQTSGKEIIFEVGTEEQSGSTNTQEELDYTLQCINQFARQSSTSANVCGSPNRNTVMEMRNIGSFDTPLRVKDELPAEIQVPKMIQICTNNGIYMKEHNADYLSDEALYWHPRLAYMQQMLPLNLE